MTAPLAKATDGGRDQDPALLQANVLQVLEEHRSALRAEAELWLERHHQALCAAVVRACSEASGSLGAAADMAQLGAAASCSSWSAKLGEGRPGAAPCDATVAATTRGTVTVAGGEDRAAAGDGAGTEDPPVRRRKRSHLMDKLMERSDLDNLVPGSVRARVYALVKDRRFDMFIGTAIILTTVVMFVKLELNGRRADALLEGRHVEGSDATSAVLDASMHFFNVLFFLELLLKLFVFRSLFFCSRLNLMDLAIVVITGVDAYILSLVGLGGQDLGFLRIMRFLRLTRAFKMIRTMAMFRQLRVLLDTITSGFGSFFWSMALLFVLMLIGALLICQVLQDSIMDITRDPLDRAWMSRYYGTSFRALYTMFEATFSGCWPTYARPLIERVSVWYAAFFVAYVTAVVFSTVRIVSALFLRDTMQIAAQDTDMMVYEKKRQAKTLQDNLFQLFQEVDESGDGRLSWDEFSHVLEHPKVRVWMAALGLDTNDALALFDALDNGDGELEWEEFCAGITRLKAGVRAQDVFRIDCDCRRILKHCVDMREAMRAMAERSPAAPWAVQGPTTLARGQAL